MLPTLIIGVLVLGLLGAVAIFFLIAAWRLRMPAVEGIETSVFPPDQLEVLHRLAHELEKEGFVFAGMQRESRRPRMEFWQAVFRSEDSTLWAVVERTGKQEPRIVFHTYFKSGRAVTTSDGEFADYDVTDQWRLSERTWRNLGEQLKHHRQAVLGCGAGLVALPDAEQFRGWYLQSAQGQFEHLKEIEFLVPIPNQPGEYKVKPWRAPLVAGKILLHSQKNKFAEKSRKRDAEYQAELDAEAEEKKRYGGIGEYKYLEYYKKDKDRGSGLAMLGWTVKGAFLTVSIVVLILIAWVQGAVDPTTIGIIVGVLLVHELGHVAMMIVFGYRDLHVLFLPLLGNIAPERNLRVPSWQEFLVLLMGPLPGLVVGVGLMVYGFLDPALPEFWKTVGLWAAVINYLNFLAVAPYDGGRVVNLLIFERVPALRLVYAIGSAVAMVALCLILWAVLGSPPLILLIPAASAFVAIPDNWRMAKMAPWASHNLRPEDDETDALMKAFQIVEQTNSVRGLEKRGWTNFVDRVVRFGCSKKMGFGGTAAAFLFFFVFLATPLVAVIAVGMKEQMAQAEENQEVGQRLVNLESEISWETTPVSRTQRDLLDGLLADYLQLKVNNHLGEEMVGTGSVLEIPSMQVERDGVSLPTIRKIKWDQAATWAEEEEPVLRERVLKAAVLSLALSAEEEMAYGSRDKALGDASKAYYAIVSCPPSTSLGAWIDWLGIEESLLRTLEQAGSEEAIPLQYNTWFSSTIRRHRAPDGKKLAYLLIRELDSGGLESAVGFVPAPPQPGKRNTTSLGKVIIATPLRRSKADEPFRREEDLRPRDLRSMLDLARLAQGLPTSGDVEAGLIVADAWSEGGLDAKPWEQIEDKELQARWKARWSYIQRVLHYRKLAVTGIEMELAVQRQIASGQEFRTVPLVEATVAKTGRGRKLTTLAPDGSKLTWRLSTTIVEKPAEPNPVETLKSVTSRIEGRSEP